MKKTENYATKFFKLCYEVLLFAPFSGGTGGSLICNKGKISFIRSYGKNAPLFPTDIITYLNVNTHSLP